MYRRMKHKNRIINLLKRKEMRKKIVAMMMAAALVVSTAACGSSGGDAKGEANTGSEPAATSEVANKDKPLVWFNRQPSNSSTGELDKTALNFNKDTYYVGFDANQGAEVQGQMVKEYIEKNILSLVQEEFVKLLVQVLKKTENLTVLLQEQTQMEKLQRLKTEKLKLMVRNM